MDNRDCGICNLLNRYIHKDDHVKIVYESLYSLAVYSTKPFAQIHIFIMSKKHIPTIFDLTEEDDGLVIDMMKAIKAASKEVIALKGIMYPRNYIYPLKNIFKTEDRAYQ